MDLSVAWLCRASKNHFQTFSFCLRPNAEAFFPSASASASKFDLRSIPGTHDASDAFRQDKFIAKILSVQSSYFGTASDQRHVVVLEGYITFHNLEISGHFT